MRSIIAMVTSLPSHKALVCRAPSVEDASRADFADYQASLTFCLKNPAEDRFGQG
jgi:hypothetical protein